MNGTEKSRIMKLQAWLDRNKARNFFSRRERISSLKRRWNVLEFHLGEEFYRRIIAQEIADKEGLT